MGLRPVAESNQCNFEETARMLIVIAKANPEFLLARLTHRSMERVFLENSHPTLI
jgi:hypothetical protein